MAKKRSTRNGPLQVVNRVVENFLIKVGVDDAFRKRFNEASSDERRTILKTEFNIGDKSIVALLSGDPGRVTARLRFSDQQGTLQRGSKPRSKKKK